ncbi:MAG TPA: glycine/sarcosine/betaine reductase complex component C subunit beta [Syntrophomonadaceae bacterium]|nr:glycine/sarcosine/betaine reductase complex component C subunit beta [Syntrophomonadaceae bacterium]HQA07237.1 glycine/sarcosine/betaine reductase complex component C subunit beta [Syntrophomonadaceae bacterium]HQE22426.1 glycine/sarcosine/betaine reductase complex component C subunit beta [Syntrophomonadaceae bacterium]
MEFPVIKAAAYVLVHAPDILYWQGTTPAMERITNPDSQFLKTLPQCLRSYADAVKYPPNQVYIGNLSPEQLRELPQPWFQQEITASSQGKYGQIVDQGELYALLKLVDRFNLVELEEQFSWEQKKKLEAQTIFSASELTLLDQGTVFEDIEKLVESGLAEGLYQQGKLVGCVREAHEYDPNLKAHVVMENLVNKASAVLALKNLLAIHKIDPADIDYIIETSEEAIGDMNQRGGGNLAKAVGEAAGLVNATGVDLRGFCAGPVHGLVNAASLVQSGIFNNVVLIGGGSTAKLGMNSKDHIAKGSPVLEDMLGSFAVLISKNDGNSPVLRTDIIGRHKIGSGSAPQAVIQAIVVDPLIKNNLRITDIDLYAPELQNPEITMPAGAGDVPLANYKMIGAMAVKRGELEKQQLLDFCHKHGIIGFAPTQGHIPSGIPAIGHIVHSIQQNQIKRAMIIGKGSLFLGRMTDLFDGISIVIEKNPGELENRVTVAQQDVKPEKKGITIGLTIGGGEIDVQDMLSGARQAVQANPDLNVVIIGQCDSREFTVYAADSEEAIRQTSEQLLQSGIIDGLVTMHYPFPIGVTTIGKVITPAQGKEMYIASTTGTADTNRVQAMVKNAVFGLAVARTEGKTNPTVGILNVEGARQVERHLQQMQSAGYQFTWGSSLRQDGGPVLRGNDLITGSVDVCVTDSLTGNVLMKLFSSFNSGGLYETIGYGYGPGIGEDFNRLICIISRASGAPVISAAISYCANLVKNKWQEQVKKEIDQAKKCGWIVSREADTSTQETEIVCPPAKTVDCEIHGIDILELDEAIKVLWKEGIFASSGMGCTGPVIMVNSSDYEKACRLLNRSNQ